MVTIDGQDTVQIPLEYNAGTGFEWNYEASPEGVVTYLGKNTEDLEDNPEVTGGALRDVFEFQALKPGEVTITFNLARSWEDGEPAETQVYAFTVSDDLQMTLNPYKSDFDLEPIWKSHS